MPLMMGSVAGLGALAFDSSRDTRQACTGTRRRPSAGFFENIPYIRGHEETEGLLKKSPKFNIRAYRKSFV